MFRNLFRPDRQLCPFCFEYFSMAEAPFRCTSPAVKCSPEPDNVLADQWGDALLQPRVIAPGHTADSARCPSCNNESHKRICPLCHMEIPREMGKFKTCIFSIIGAKDSGKSHYIAVLINQIRRQIGREFGMHLGPINDATINRYNTEFSDPVFEMNTCIRGTLSGLADVKVRNPLVYSLNFKRKNFLGREKKRDKVVYLVFFDTAGEDLNDKDIMSTVNKYIYRSDGIILLIDPLQLDQVRIQLGSGVGMPDMQAETADIIARTTNLIEEGRGVGRDTKIPIPLAVAFSKFDAVRPLIDGQFQLLASPDHRGCFDERDRKAVNTEMMALLDDWGGGEIVDMVGMRYERSSFFGLSALGCNPHGTNSIPRVIPHRVADPFLWLLAQHRLIRSVESKRR
jgi:hypothetical protein